MAAPEQIGKYPISRRLGKGGMGEVWLGRNPDLDLPVAIKTLARHLVEDDPTFVERFVVEARTAARLTSDHIVRIYDAGSDDETNYLVMEYVEGGSVRDKLTDGPLPVGLALRIAACVARGLEAAAKLDIIHRDIKPDNILLDADGTPKLADLGLAKQLGGSDGHSLTTTGISVGTPAYISPEQAEDSKNVDARTDIYSLGATLFHMLTGRPPYQGSSAFSVMMKHATEPVPDPCERNPSIPADVGALIVRMMAKSPTDRPQTAAALAAELEALAVRAATEAETAPLPATPPSAEAADLASQPTTVLSDPLAETLPAGAETVVADPLGPAGDASLVRRAEAVAVDVVLVIVANALLGNWPPGFWILFALYHAVLLPRDGQTLGKRWFGLRVVAATGGLPTRNAAIVRALAAIAGALCAGIGLLYALWDGQRRALHDLLAGTRVVSCRPTEAPD